MHSKEINPIPYKLANSRGRTARRKKEIPAANITFTTRSCPKVSICSEIIKELAYPHTVQVGLSKNGIVLSRKLKGAGGETTYFKLKQLSKYHVIESTSLVKEINNVFNLKYKGKITLSFDEVEFFNEGRRRVAHIPLVTREG